MICILASELLPFFSQIESITFNGGASYFRLGDGARKTKTRKLWWLALKIQDRSYI